MSASWTPERITWLLECCVDEYKKGNATSTGFKAKGFTAIVASFNKKATLEYTRDKVIAMLKTPSI